MCLIIRVGFRIIVRFKGQGWSFTTSLRLVIFKVRVRVELFLSILWGAWAESRTII